MRKLPWATLAILVAAATVSHVVGCGSESDDITPSGADGGDARSNNDANPGNNGDGSTTNDSGNRPTTRPDAATCKLVGASCTGSGECCTANCEGNTCAPAVGSCKAPGTPCGAPNECCTGSCVNGSCSDKQCVPDKPTAGTCGVAGDCCSGICTNNLCTSVNPGQTCRTANNPCGNDSECCSNNCNGGLCSSAVSFCTQQGEICSTNFECCSGSCLKTGTNTTGTCGAPTNGGGVPSGCMPSGTVCGRDVDGGATATDGGLLPCDQNCCSRSCGYFGALSGFRVCQPPSGCRPTGEVCRNDSDCCGWSGAPDPVEGPVTCSKTSPTAEFGQCNNGGSCREPGSICKPGDGDSCSAENNCCEAAGLGSSYCNNNPENCCNKDALGIPRCLIRPVDCLGNDGGTPPAAGAVCATSADCCGNPCVDNRCGAAGSCVAQGGACTVTADCCPGLPCVQAPGSTAGVCGGSITSDGGVSDAAAPSPADGGNLPDGGSCALYGQLCTALGDCCNAVPCTGGRCRYP